MHTEVHASAATLTPPSIPQHDALEKVRQIEQQIAELQEHAKQLMILGRQSAIDTIKHLIASYDLQPEDIGMPALPKKNTRPSAPRPVKYRDPVSGETWTGQGKTPRWLEGKNREDYRIRPVTEPSAEPAPAQP